MWLMVAEVSAHVGYIVFGPVARSNVLAGRLQWSKAINLIMGGKRGGR